MSNIQTAIDQLHFAFNSLNHVYFNSELPEPAILIMTRGKRQALGWCTNWENWSDQDGNDKKFEINISAEFLNRPYMDIMRTLLHEMVHLYNAANQIKDTSRGGTYHNKTFKAECERRGFWYTGELDKRYGWAFAELKPDTIKQIEQFGITQDDFLLARESESGSNGKAKANSYKWECPECKIKLRSTKMGISIRCNPCNKTLVLMN